jgi:hypothetical protein
VKWTIKPFNAIEQAEFTERLASIPEGLKERAERVYEAFEWLLNAAVKNIEGLEDEDGSAIDFEVISKKDLALGLSPGDFANLCDAITEINTIPENAKKKSSQPPESGMGS